MNSRQSVVYLAKAKQLRQMSLQVDSMWNELNKPHPQTKEKQKLKLSTEYAM